MTVLDSNTDTASGTTSATCLLSFWNGLSGAWCYVHNLAPVTVVQTIRTAVSLTAQGSAQISTSQYKVGSASLSLPSGSGSDLVTHSPATEFAFGTGDFCVEGWFYASSWSSYRCLYTCGSNSNAGNFSAYINGGTTLEVYNRGVGPALYTQGGFSLSTNTWYHIAISRASNTMKLFIDGVQQGSGSTLNYTFYSVGTAAIGADSSGGGYNFQGYIDDFRVSKGAARYTGNFTPSTSALVDDINTSLLCHFEGSNGSTSILDDNT